jgi:N-acetylmuramoyl-L-alanine amidase
MFRSIFFCLIFPFILSASKPIVGAIYENIKKPLIVLDAGHGGLDEGAKIRYPYCEEKKLTLTTALLTKKYLEQMGYRVRLTRYRDFYVPLQKRVLIANDANAEIFVSIHFNSCPNSSASGIEIFYHDSKENKKKSLSSQKLAKVVLNKTVFRTNAVSRGIKKGNLVVNKDTDMPSILIEGGFLTNPKERDSIRKVSYLEKMAKGISEGIDRFFKLHKIQ